MAANEQLLQRRVFMEAVLSGVSAGVLGLDAERRITIANSSAEKLLGLPEAELVGRPLSGVVPEFAQLLERSGDDAIRPRAQDQATLVIDGEERTFAVRITTQQERGGGYDQGTVVTFDDITELVSAQRTSAWADVARRIAHEIKNPLTPIQLSAERIRRKYSAAIKDDRETFDRLTETIVRQVGDIKSMVDEFASFARMPKPLMEEHDLRDAVQEPVVLFRESHPGIEFKLELPRERVRMLFDRRLITQAITNLVKNAVEAVQSVADSADRPNNYRGRVETVLKVDGERAVIEVIDNGVGLAKHNRMRLLEPYVTTKAKGTGLGLAIVQKVIEQHGGALALDDAPAASGAKHGALVRLTLPIRRGEAVAVNPPAAAE
jgi:two-component system nitrogen regulation sensor histidine kinase NtrY